MKHGIEADAESSERVVQLELERIVPNRLQPRKRFGQAQLRQLADSLQAQGVIQPIVVRRHPQRHGQYEIVAGERRLRAMHLLGWRRAPALVRTIPEEHLLETALVENLQREPLTPIEEAQAYRALLEHHGYTQDTLARRVGRDRSTVANLLRLLRLPARLQQDLDEARMSVGHARALLALDGVEPQLALREIILEQGLSVRETERRVNKALRRTGRGGGAAEPGAAANPKLDAAQEALENRFRTRVAISQGAKAGGGMEPGGGMESGGRIEIEYYSVDDFNRIYDLLISG